MKLNDLQKSIDGYDQIIKEIEICRKYGIDYSAQNSKWKEMVERLHPRRLRLRVAAKIKETESACTLRMVAANGVLPPFQAGQYINLLLAINGIHTGRPYSISSPPNQIAYYDLTIQRVAGGLVSNYLLDQVMAGDILDSTGPAGNFYYNPLFHGTELVFLAGGSGVTPFMSMIREFADKGDTTRNIHLFYGVKSVTEAIFHEELLNLSRNFSNLTYDLVVSDMNGHYAGLTGLLDARLLQKRLGDLTGKTFYICGPKAMHDFCTAQLHQLGIPRRHIRQEVMGAPLHVHLEPGWPEKISPDAVFSVKLINTGHSLPVKASESLLTALERSGIVVENCCRSGECSLCRVKLLSGEVFQPEGVLLRQADQITGYIHSCAAYPLCDLEIML